MNSEQTGKDIIVEITRSFDGIDIDSARLETLVRAVCNRFGAHKATVSIALVDDSQIRQTNRDFLNRDCITDCLSFDLSDNHRQPGGRPAVPEHPRGRQNTERAKARPRPGQGEKASAAPQPDRAFEVLVNGQMAVRESHLRGHPAQSEAALYITHGLLHQLGFDDTLPLGAGKMHRTEDAILEEFGFGAVYGRLGR